MNIFLFTRDLRIEDNTGLICAMKKSPVTPVFILNPAQLKSSYKSNNAIQFMCESLEELNNSLKKKNSRLHIFYGDPVTILKKLKPDCIHMNVDYTPFARKRENQIKKIAKEFYSYEDYMLTCVNEIKKPDGTNYVKFTPYYNKASKIIIRKPATMKYNFAKTTQLPNEYKKSLTELYTENKNILVRGGRNNALKILKNIKNFKNYNKTRDFMSNETTHLSAYLKFNVVSIREVYYAFKKINNNLIKQLYWRDFYMNIIYHNPHVIGNNMKNYNIKWINDKTLIKKWKEGTTGIPIVDAGMRQMNEIGYMHNRARMIVSNILVKIFHVDWRIGEKYFAQKLVDYDPANNNGGWQWSSSTGTDSQPYFRYFNPWSQAQKYDPECLYIKKWIPELRNTDNKVIHNWYTEYVNYKIYYEPVKPSLDIQKEMIITKKYYKQV